MVLPAPFFSMCPMILIQRALCCLHPGEHFTYPEGSSKCYEKFFRDPQSQATVFEGGLDIQREGHLKLFDLDFVKNSLAAFLTAPFFSMCPMILIQRAQCCLHPGEYFTYPERSSKCYEKFFRDPQSQVIVFDGGLKIHRGGHLKFFDLDFVKNGLAAFLTAPFFFLCVL